MKTQFIVTITQSGDREMLTPAVLERELRAVARGKFVTIDEGTVSVSARHIVENAPAPVGIDKQALHTAIREAHRAGQLTGRLLGKEGGARAPASTRTGLWASWPNDRHLYRRRTGEPSMPVVSERPTVTGWHSIDAEGQPLRPGWYECLYEGEPDDTENPATLYWDGLYWRFWPGAHDATSFGNYPTAGERWRGAATPHCGWFV